MSCSCCICTRGYYYYYYCCNSVRRTRTRTTYDMTAAAAAVRATVCIHTPRAFTLLSLAADTTRRGTCTHAREQRTAALARLQRAVISLCVCDLSLSLSFSNSAMMSIQESSEKNRALNRRRCIFWAGRAAAAEATHRGLPRRGVRSLARSNFFSAPSVYVYVCVC